MNEGQLADVNELHLRIDRKRQHSDPCMDRPKKLDTYCTHRQATIKTTQAIVLRAVRLV